MPGAKAVDVGVVVAVVVGDEWVVGVVDSVVVCVVVGVVTRQSAKSPRLWDSSIVFSKVAVSLQVVPSNMYRLNAHSTASYS